MTTVERPAIEARVLSALQTAPARIPVLVGAGGTGRTSLLLRLRERLGQRQCQYVDAEQAATTPEGFLLAITADTPFPPAGQPRILEDRASARDAFDLSLTFLGGAQTASGEAAVFLLDEVLELRTFESFPGLRMVLRDLVDVLGRSPNRFVLSTRYVARALRLLRDAPGRFEIIHLPPLAPSEVRDALVAYHLVDEGGEIEEVARAVHALTDGRPSYLRIVAEAMQRMREQGGYDPVAALAAQMARGAELWAECRFTYELRLHRARGYGALKAILRVLADEEPLTLTEIAHRLRRTPGSTKDYLSWLEDVDLIAVDRKRYTFSDPLLRLWVRLHCRPVPLDDEVLAREVQHYAHTRLPHSDALAGAATGTGAREYPTARDRAWGIIEID